MPKLAGLIVNANTEVYFQDDFHVFDQSVWVASNSGGLISTGDDGLTLSSTNSRNFPFVYTSKNIFPESGNYSISVDYQFPTTTHFGVGFGLGNLVPTYSLPSYSNPNIESGVIFFNMWQSLNDKHLLQSKHCATNDVCDAFRTTLFLKPPIASNHRLTINFIDNRFEVLHSSNNQTPEIISNQVLNNTLRRPTVFWIGNPAILETNNNWTKIRISRVVVTREVAKTPVVILPGFGGSWDVSAILTNTPGNNWKIPDFVKEYDGIISSLENAGYKENEDLFVFAYDWRKPLNTLADDLSSFLISKNISSGKFSLVGHSMGGLVARTYLQKYNNPNTDKVITAGSPHKGILDAYAMWEGLIVWDAVWWQKAMHLIATEVNRESGELKIESARRNAPSVKDLLPTDPFLKLGKSTLPISNMIWKNDTLANLNSQVGSFSQKIVSGFSSSNQTKSDLSVSKAPKEDILRGLWEDGKPVAKNPFSFSIGDGYVTSSSSGSLFGNTITLDGWHGETISKKENVVKILSELGVATESAVGSSFDNRKKFLVFKLNSPGTLSVCLASTCNEQIGQYFAPQKMLIVPGFTDGDYKVEILAQGETGKYELVTGKIDEEQDWDSQQGELKSTTQTDSYLYNTKMSELAPNKLTANNNLLNLFPAGVDPRKVNKIRQDVLKKVDAAMRINDAVVFDNEIAKWSALDGYVQTMEHNKINWFSNKDWDEHHFGLYKSKYLPKTKSYFNEVLFSLVTDLEESSKFVNKKDWLKILDEKVQLLQLKHFLGHTYSSGF